jgi:hypothetical protein
VPLAERKTRPNPAIHAAFPRAQFTLGALQVWLRDQHKVSASAALICKTVNQLDLTLKESPCGQLSRTGRTSPQREPNGGKSSRVSIPAS